MMRIWAGGAAGGPPPGFDKPEQPQPSAASQPQAADAPPPPQQPAAPQAQQTQVDMASAQHAVDRADSLLAKPDTQQQAPLQQQHSQQLQQQAPEQQPYQQMHQQMQQQPFQQQQMPPFGQPQQQQQQPGGPLEGFDIGQLLGSRPSDLPPPHQALLQQQHQQQQLLNGQRSGSLPVFPGMQLPPQHQHQLFPGMEHHHPHQQHQQQPLDFPGGAPMLHGGPPQQGGHTLFDQLAPSLQQQLHGQGSQFHSGASSQDIFGGNGGGTPQQQLAKPRLSAFERMRQGDSSAPAEAPGADGDINDVLQLLLPQQEQQQRAEALHQQHQQQQVTTCFLDFLAWGKFTLLGSLSFVHHI